MVCINRKRITSAFSHLDDQESRKLLEEGHQEILQSECFKNAITDIWRQILITVLLNTYI